MAYAAALSTHPISSHATGEVIGQLLEAVGAGADLLVLLATPGHGGALEDIASTARRLLAPGTLLAAVTSGLGVGEEWVASGPGLAAWAGGCGPLVAVTPGDPWPSPTEVTATLNLATPVAAHAGPSWPARRAGLPGLGGTVDGPISLDDAPPGPGPVGIAFGPGSGIGLVVVRGLRGLGPALEVTRAERAMIYELDGRPALQQLIDLARDGMPVADLPGLAQGLHLRVSGPVVSADDGPDRSVEPLPVLGVDRANGAIAVTVPVCSGDIVQFAVPDPAAVRTGLGRALDVTPAGALVFTTAAGGRHLASRATAPPRGRVSASVLDDDLLGWVDPPSPLPAATLVCAVAPAGADGRRRSGPSVTTATVAHFPRMTRPG